MGLQFKRLIGVLCIVAASTGVNFAQKATAQPFQDDRIRYQTIPDAFEKTFFSNDRNFYDNRNPVREVKTLIGPFNDNEIASDGKAINSLYRKLLNQQITSDPFIRTPDLPSPYDSSLLSLPSGTLGGSTRSGEFFSEQVPVR